MRKSTPTNHPESASSAASNCDSAPTAEPPRRPRIALTGSAGVGKTTLGRALGERLDLPFIPEQMRLRLEAGLDPHTLSFSDWRALQLELRDTTAALIDAAVTEHGGVVVDRSPADFAAYWLYYDFADPIEETEAVMDRAQRDMALFDMVLVLPWGAMTLEDDGVRSANRWRQLHFQSLVEGMTDHLASQAGGVPIHRLPVETVDLEARTRWALDLLTAQAAPPDQLFPPRAGA